MLFLSYNLYTISLPSSNLHWHSENPVYSIYSQLCYDMPIKLITEWIFSAISATRVVYKNNKKKKLFFYTCKKGIFLNINFQSQSQTP